MCYYGYEHAKTGIIAKVLGMVFNVEKVIMVKNSRPMLLAMHGP